MFKYYLIAFNDSKVRKINIDNAMLNVSENIVTSLNFIDELTMKFDENNLREKLFSAGIIDHKYTPLIIAKPYLDVHNNKRVDFFEILYKKSKEITKDNEALYKKFINEYNNNLNFKKIANEVIDEYEIENMKKMVNHFGITTTHIDVRNMTSVFNIYDEYQTLENYKSQLLTYKLHEKEIYDLLTNNSKLVK